MKIKPLKALLSNTNILLENQRKLTMLKGETFNIFSVLRMETNENETHSAFLCELLNPKGSHHKGNIFLHLFLQTIQNKSIEIKTAKVKVEEVVGWLNVEAKTGGRVDIYIQDVNGNTICIENKIHAGDQPAQIERYRNHNTSKNSVYYLNLHGSAPTKESCGDLIAGTDFHIISYKNEIIEWLRECMKKSLDTPILHETIRQYIILIQKLTSTIDQIMEKEFLELMLHHFDESAYIANNFEKARLSFCEEIRRSVLSALKQRIGDLYEIIQGASIGNSFAQIWLKDKSNPTFEFGIETFNGYDNHKEGYLFVGLWDASRAHSSYVAENNSISFAKYWINPEIIPDFSYCRAHLNNRETLIKLYTDETFKQGFVEHIVDNVSAYIKKQTTTIQSYLSSKASL